MCRQHRIFTCMTLQTGATAQCLITANSAAPHLCRMAGAQMGQVHLTKMSGCKRTDHDGNESANDGPRGDGAQ